MQPRRLDLEIAGLAGRQHGVVSRRQLVELGMSESGVERRLRVGRLHVLHPGVYAVGHRLVSREGHWLAGVLRAGPGAILSHRSAAALWGVRRGGGTGAIEVTCPRKTRSHGRIRRHCGRVPAEEATSRRRIPVTTLARTLMDLAALVSLEGLEAAIREAEYLHRFRLQDLAAIRESHPGRRGVARVDACLELLGHGPRGRTRTRLESRFAALLARTDLPPPRLNALLDLDGFRIEADCLWSEQRLIVELDGGEAHGTRTAFESDRERDRRLQVAGWRIVRVTWRQLNDPSAVIADLRQLLSAPATFG
jgi:very-short-patch-repair endonuclease